MRKPDLCKQSGYPLTEYHEVLIFFVACLKEKGKTKMLIKDLQHLFYLSDGKKIMYSNHHVVTLKACGTCVRLLAGQRMFLDFFSLVT